MDPPDRLISRFVTIHYLYLLYIPGALLIDRTLRLGPLAYIEHKIERSGNI